MAAAGSGIRGFLARLASAVSSGRVHLTETLGGAARTRVILVLAGVLGLSSADVATVGASATELRHSLAISNTDLGLLVTVTSLVAAVTTLPFGVLADRVHRTWTLGAMVACWGAAMIWSATAGSFGSLLLPRLVLGVATAAAGPMIASLIGDYFPGSERGRVYGYILTGDLLGAGFGFAVTGDIAALSWRVAFALLALPAFGLAWAMFRLPEPGRGGRGPLPAGETPADGGDRARHPAAEVLAPDGAATDVRRLARERGLIPDPDRVPPGDPRRLGRLGAVRYVLRIRTNLVLIIASACGYYFMAGVETFGTEFTREQYHLSQAVANLRLVALGAGAGAVAGVLVGGTAADALLRRFHLNGRILVVALAATGTVVLFIPAIFTRDLIAALPY
ncbi:MAG: MFS transporter, partial [Trebonia sp.]